jgi:undecaprenyl-diphosphatase
MESLIELDKEIFLFLNNLGSSFFDPFWLFITHKFSSIPLYLLFVYLLYRNFGLQKTITALVVVAIMITITDQFSMAVKHSVERLRPCREPSIEGLGRFITRCGSYGYFSGHATSSFALAIYLGMIFKKTYKYFFLAIIIWAFFVSYSRIYVGVHYPGDVLTGIFVGSMVGYGCFLLFRLLSKRFNKVSAT